MRTVTFSPEFRHLLDCSRAALGLTEWPVGADSLRWPAFLAAVERHRVGAFLYSRRPNGVAPSWPVGVEAGLKQMAGATLQRAVRQMAEQLRLIRALRAGGIDARCVKGVVLAQQTYGALGRRHVGDVDLLVPPADVAASDRIIRTAGYSRTRPDFELSPRQWTAYLKVKPEFEYGDGSGTHRVELLWRAEAIPETEIWRAAPVEVRVAGDTLMTLPPHLNALFLCQHGARHGWFRLFWLIDIALLLRPDSGVDWTEVLRQAARSGEDRSVRQALALAREILGVAVPSAIVAESLARREVRSLVASAKEELARHDVARETAVLWSKRLWYRTRLRQTLPGKYAVLAPHLHSPETWRTLHLPDRWFGLYPIATPFWWLARRVRRAAARRA